MGIPKNFTIIETTGDGNAEYVPIGPRMSVATRKLIDALKDGKPGEEITDAELEVIAGGPCAPGEKHYAHLMSAIKNVLSDQGVVWQRQHGERKIVCADNAGKFAIANHVQNGIRRRARYGKNVMGTVDIKKLPRDEQSRVSARVAIFGSVEGLTRGTTVKKLEALPAPVEMNTDKMIEFMK